MGERHSPRSALGKRIMSELFGPEPTRPSYRLIAKQVKGHTMPAAQETIEPSDRNQEGSAGQQPGRNPSPTRPATHASHPAIIQFPTEYRPSISELNSYYQDHGVIGEQDTAYLQTIGAIRRMHFGIVSPSGTGKSHTIDRLISLLPEGAVYTMGLSSDKAEMYNSDRINASSVIYIPELQKAMASKNALMVEVLKNLTEGKDAVRLVRDQGRGVTEEQRISAGKGVIFTLAIENEFKYDTEFARRVFTLHTDPSSGQTQRIVEAIAEGRQGQGAAPGSYRSLRAHLGDCLADTTRAYENPFADAIAAHIPSVKKARSYARYLFDLMEGSALFHNRDRLVEGGRTYLTVQDVKSVHDAYWDQFVRSLLDVPFLGERTLALFDDRPLDAKTAYHGLIDQGEEVTPLFVERTLEALVDAGYLRKDDYKTSRPNYTLTQKPTTTAGITDWGALQAEGTAYMHAKHPDIADRWLAEPLAEAKYA